MLIDFQEVGRQGKRERKRNVDLRETLICTLTHWGLNPQPRHVP